MKLDTSQIGLNRAMRKLSSTAHKTASHGANPGKSKENYVNLTIDRVTARQSFEANLAVRKTEDDVQKSIIDIFA